MANLKKNPEVIALIEEAVTKAVEKANKTKHKELVGIVKETIKAEADAQKEAGNKVETKLVKGLGVTLLEALDQ